MRSLGASLFAALMVLCSIGKGSAMSPPPPEATVAYVDLHVDLPYQHNYKGVSFSRGTGQFAADQAVRGGLRGVVLPLFVPVTVSPEGPRLSDFEQCWQAIQNELKSQSVYAQPGVKPEPGQVRTFYSFEGMGPFANDLQSLEVWVHRGVRLFGLVHNQHNALASSSMDPHPVDFGLTERGRRAVSRIYELGGVVDVSHASDRAAAEVVQMALSVGRPVVASHSNARRLMNHPRNLSDELLDGIAKTGGIIGINFHSAFLVSGRRATLADVVKQVVYVSKRVGSAHVAMGSDYEGGIRAPRGLSNLGQVQHLVPALRSAGLDESTVRAVLGGNALRILAPEP